MIGPHQGKELELMIAGQKHLAVFHDAVVEGKTISEQIIPEKSFAPYVASGAIKKFSKIYISPIPVQYLCYTLPGHEWRAEAFFWLHEDATSGRRPFDSDYEFFIGRLLDYSEQDIIHFIEHQKSFRSAIRT